MPVTARSTLAALRHSAPGRRLLGYAATLGIVAVASIARSIASPFFHNQIHFSVYTASIVVATWFFGEDAGALAVITSALVANYFIRHVVIPTGDGWGSIESFAIVSAGLVWFVGRRRRAELEARRLHEQIRTAALAAEVGVWTWTPRDGGMSVGANWRRLFGVGPRQDVTLDAWMAALHPDDRTRALATLNEAWRCQTEFSSEYRVVHPDGQVRWIVDRGRALYEPGGAPAGLTGINLDITERKAAEQVLRDANRTKDEFIATLSHELRTPLSAIVGWSDMLQRGLLQGDAASRAVRAVHRNANLLTQMISDLLDVSRIASGKLHLEMEPLDVTELLRSAVESIRPAAALKGLTIRTDIDSMPHVVTGDATRLQQVFWNLLSNAIKFTPTGGEISVSTCSDEDRIQIRVQDTGIGIAEEFLPHVFDAFRQKDSSLTRSHAGLGLGLAIVRHIVGLHGGSTEASSAGGGRGALFTVTLPARAIERRRVTTPVRRPALTGVPGDALCLGGVKVLVVDDEPEAREVAASLLRCHGASVAVAADAAQAVERVEQFEPDVMLLDIAMPEVDGYTLLERLRGSGGKGAAIPAIALTALARQQDRQRAFQSGFQLHLAKPVDNRTLVKAVKDAVNSQPS
jgi:PAS domain S-box-containing protein